MAQSDPPVEEELVPNQKVPISFIGLILLLCAAGGFLLLWPFEDDRSLYWYRSHLEIIDSQLQGLKELLQDYKSRHGRYPTNDEGLATLDNFESRFTLTYYIDSKSVRPLESSGFTGVGTNRFWWQNSRESLLEYRNQHGKMPQNAEEFRETHLSGFLFDEEEEDMLNVRRIKKEIGIDRHGNVFLFDRSGILSPWLLPYNYENRVGSKPQAFEGSLADGNRWGYSIQVDDGVFISSVGGYLYTGKLNELWWERYGPRFPGGLLIAIGFTLAILGFRKKRSFRPLWAIVAVIAGFFVGVHMIHRVTCYIMSNLFSHRSPEMVAMQRDLLEKYRNNGVISEETYRRAVSAVERDAAQQEENSEKPSQ